MICAAWRSVSRARASISASRLLSRSLIAVASMSTDRPGTFGTSTAAATADTLAASSVSPSPTRRVRISRPIAAARKAASSSVVSAKQIRKPPSAVRDQVSRGPQRRLITCSALAMARAATAAQRDPSASFTSSRPISLILPATCTVAGGASGRCSTVMMRKRRRSSRCTVVEVISTGTSVPSARSEPRGHRVVLAVLGLPLSRGHHRRTSARAR